MTFDIKAPLFHDMIRLNGRWYPDKAAIVCADDTISWGSMDARTNRVAHGLVALGVGQSDAVAVLMSNCIEYVEVMYGVFKTGAVIVPLNLAVSDQGIVAMLSDADARIVFCTDDQYARLDANRSSLATGLLIIVVSDREVADADIYSTWIAQQSATDPRIEIDDDAPCNIIYSSGTTGLPKGIKHTYRRRIQSMYELALAHRYHFASVSICPIGLYSNIAWASLFCSLIVGGTCVVQDKFTESSWLEAVKAHGVTHTFMVPIQFQRILDAPGFTPDAVASLQAIVSGGSPLFDGLKRRVSENFNCAVIELYGLTEGFMTTMQPEESVGRTGSVGKPVRGHDFIIVNEADDVMPWGETGEICVRSVHWMIEYHNRPDATRETEYIDPDGVQWLRTGDIGRTDDQGYLYITDRKKDMIVSGGQNIYPVDIESVLIAHPSVAEVAVIGVVDPKWGETPVAIIILKSGKVVSAADVLDWVNERVGKRQRVRDVFVRDDLPRNPNGKVLKRDLRRLYS